MSESNTSELSDEQISLLLDAREVDEPVVVDAGTLEQIKGVMADALRETTGLPAPEALEIEQMADQLEADHSSAVDALTRQQPETGGAGVDEIDADEPDEPETVVDALEQADAETRKEAKRLVSTARTLADRTPDHADQLRAEAADLLGVDADQIDEIDAPSDPRMV